MLNPGLTWGDVSIETKLRLKTLPVEAVSMAAKPQVAASLYAVHVT